MSKILIDKAVIEQVMNWLSIINEPSAVKHVMRLEGILGAALEQPLEQNKSDNYLNEYCTGRTELLTEQSVEQEPVGFCASGGYSPPRQPLTDEQIVPLFSKRQKQQTKGEKDAWYFYAWGVNDGEAAHGIKEQKC